MDERHLLVHSIISRAPGRICLFGDHQDYLHLPVIACAIDRYITISARPRVTPQTTVYLPDIQDQFSFSFDTITDQVHTNSNERQYGRNTHMMDAIKVVRRVGCQPTGGFEIEIKGDIPINAGLSSSSALVVAWVQFLLHTFGSSQPLSPSLIGQLAYEAEVVAQGSPGGKMDQYTSALGQMIYLETKDKGIVKTFDQQVDGLIIGESGVAKNTIGLLQEVKSKALTAVNTIQEARADFELERASIGQFDDLARLLPKQQQPYFYAALKNHDITQKAFSALSEKKYNYPLLGQLMTAHHRVLKEQLHLSIPIIDNMITAALDAGAYGAKIVGSGGGGCICALAPQDRQIPVIEAIKAAGARAAYQVNISKGAQIL